MDGTGAVEAIHVAPKSGAPMESRAKAKAIADAGLAGDRYAERTGTFSGGSSGGRDLTLAEAEAIEAIEREAGIDLGFDEHRRNVTTRDVALNHLVGERFRIGSVVCEGVRLCEPCSHLESLTEDGVREALLHRGGLRADIVEGGRIEVGDEIEPIE